MVASSSAEEQPRVVSLSSANRQQLSRAAVCFGAVSINDRVLLAHGHRSVGRQFANGWTGYLNPCARRVPFLPVANRLPRTPHPGQSMVEDPILMWATDGKNPAGSVGFYTKMAEVGPTWRAHCSKAARRWRGVTRACQERAAKRKMQNVARKCRQSP